MFSKSCKYGLRGVLYLAQVSNEGNKVGVKELSEHLNIPVHFMAKILQDLARKRIISSTKGPNGGFFLTEQEKKQNLITIVVAIDGMARFEECSMGLRECSNEHPCPLHFGIKSLRQNIIDQLTNTSLDDFANKLKAGKIRLVI